MPDFSRYVCIPGESGTDVLHTRWAYACLHFYVVTFFYNLPILLFYTNNNVFATWVLNC